MDEYKSISTIIKAVLVLLLIVFVCRIDNIFEMLYIQGGRVNGIESVEVVSRFKGYADRIDGNRPENTALGLAEKEVEKYTKDIVLDNTFKKLVYVKYDVDIKKPNIIDIIFSNEESFKKNKITAKIEIKDNIKSIKFKGKLEVENKDKARVIKVADNKYILADRLDKDLYGKDVEIEILYNEIQEKNNVIERYEVIG